MPINVFGTYIHGIFDNDGIVDAIIGRIKEKKGLKYTKKTKSYEEYKNEQYDLIADTLSENLDMEYIKEIIGLKV